MVQVNSLPDDVLIHVAQGLGGKLQLLDPSMADVPVALADSFQVWLLTVPHGGETLAELATATAQWHHQIRTDDGRAVAFARSSYPSVDEDDDPALVRSSIAARLDATIAWIDEHVPEEWEARLLVAPSYHLFAFWVLEDDESGHESRVVVSDFPEGSLAVDRDQLYSEKEFLAALRNAEPITGIRSENGGLVLGDREITKPVAET